MTKVLLLRKGKKEISQQELEEYLTKYKTDLLPDYEYNLGYIKGLIGNPETPPELDKLIIGSLLIGITMAEKEKLKLIEKDLEKENIKEATYFG